MGEPASHSSRSMRPLRLVAWGLIVLLLLFAAASYAGLPEQIPAKVGLDGKVSRMAAKSIGGWFALPLIALAVHLLVSGVSALIPSRPHLFNFPEKTRFLALPGEYQGAVIVEMRTMLDIVLVGTNALMLVIQFQLWRTALGHHSPGMMIATLLVPVLMTPLILLRLSRVTTVLETEEKRWKASVTPR